MGFIRTRFTYGSTGKLFLGALLSTFISLPAWSLASSSNWSSSSDDLPSYERTIQRLQQEIQVRSSLISHPKHAPQLYDHGSKAPCVTVVTHGVFESPHFIQGIAQSFFEMGCNVYSILLPGHFDLNLKSMDKTQAIHWEKELAQGISLARPLGERLILAGYSLGALLSIQYTLKNPTHVQGLALWAPALKMSLGAASLTALGTLLPIDVDRARHMRPDGIDIAHITAKAGRNILKIENKIVKEAIQRRRQKSLPFGALQGESLSASRFEIYQEIQIPTSVAYSQADEAVSLTEIDTFARALSGPKYITLYPFPLKMTHGCLAKTPQDTYLFAPSFYNPYLEGDLDAMKAFFSKTL